MTLPIRVSCLLALCGTFASAQEAAADPLVQARERLRKSLTTTAELPSCSFEAVWGPAKKTKAEEDDDEDDAGGGAIRALGFVGMGDGSGKAAGTWTAELLHCKSDDQELIAANRRTIARSGSDAWILRKNRWADGAAVAFLPDPQLLLDLLQNSDLAVTHREVATLNDRPVEILGVTLNQDQVADLMWGGQIPEVNSFGGAAVFIAAGGGAGRVAQPKPEATVDVAFALDPASGQIHEVTVRSYTKSELAVGGRVFRVRAGGGGVVVGGPGGDDEDEKDANDQQGAAAPPLVYKNGLPERSRKKMVVNDYVLTLRDHGQAKAPELDAAAKALLRAR